MSKVAIFDFSNYVTALIFFFLLYNYLCKCVCILLCLYICSLDLQIYCRESSDFNKSLVSHLEREFSPQIKELDSF